METGKFLLRNHEITYLVDIGHIINFILLSYI
jgi:hypothetical protein